MEPLNIYVGGVTMKPTKILEFSTIQPDVFHLVTSIIGDVEYLFMHNTTITSEDVFIVKYWLYEAPKSEAAAPEGVNIPFRIYTKVDFEDITKHAESFLMYDFDLKPEVRAN